MILSSLSLGGQQGFELRQRRAFLRVSGPGTTIIAHQFSGSKTMKGRSVLLAAVATTAPSPPLLAQTKPIYGTLRPWGNGSVNEAG